MCTGQEEGEKTMELEVLEPTWCFSYSIILDYVTIRIKKYKEKIKHVGNNHT